MRSLLLLSLFVFVGCNIKPINRKCVDGYFIQSLTNNPDDIFVIFCRSYDLSSGGIKGFECENSFNDPRYRVSIFANNVEVVHTKCFNELHNAKELGLNESELINE